MGRDRDLSRSPSYRRRYSRSPSPVVRRRSSRRDRSRSRYSYSRRKSRSISPRRRKSRSPTPRRRRSRSATPRRYKRQRSISTSLSPIKRSPSTGSLELKNVTEKSKKDEEEKKRLLKEDTTIVQFDILDEQIGCIFTTVDQFSNSILWLRNVLEVCLKGISISIMPLST